jgi:hypothetical protein
MFRAIVLIAMVRLEEVSSAAGGLTDIEVLLKTPPL